MSSGKSRYALLVNEYEYNTYFRVPFEKVVVSLLGLPLLAFLFCVVYSVLFNFESATYTHCQVYNVVPSISAAIGNFSPQREIWQTAIAIQVFPRLFVAMEYWNHHQTVLDRESHSLGFIACILNIIENIALVLLSFFTSSKYFAIHSYSFTVFILVSVIHMLLVCVLQKRYKRFQNTHRHSLKWKRRCLIVNVIFMIAAVYFYMRHNSMCEPYVYSLFAVSEYMVVLSNMAFHFTVYLDFRQKDLIFHRNGFSLAER